jgi:microcystin-dependent protein
MPTLSGSNGTGQSTVNVSILPSYNGTFGYATIKDHLIVEGNATLSTLTLSGAATVGSLSSSGSIAGTLITPAQPNITSVGTLSSLTVDTALSAKTISIAPMTGDALTTTAGAVTIDGDVKLTSGRTFKVNGTSVLSATALGSGVVSSSLTSVGTLASLAVGSGGLTCAGNAAVTGTLSVTGSLSSPTLSLICPVGSLVMYVAATAPSGWLLCDGSLVSRTTHSALFAVIGTSFGTGDGSTTFALPDMRGRSPIGQGTGSGLTARTLAATGGTETHTLTVAQIPSHNHSGVTGSCNSNASHYHNVEFCDNSANAYSRAFESYGGTAVNGTYPTQSTNTDHTHNITSEGGGGSHPNMPPWLCVSFIIKT